MLYQRLVLRLGDEHAVSERFLALQASFVALEVTQVIAPYPARSQERWTVLAQVLERNRQAYFSCRRPSRTRRSTVERARAEKWRATRLDALFG